MPKLEEQITELLTTEQKNSIDTWMMWHSVEKKIKKADEPTKKNIITLLQQANRNENPTIPSEIKACTLLAYCYRHGYGVKIDYPTAAKFYQQAADQKFAIAQYYLGFCYQSGCGVNRVPRTAIEHFQQAASQGLAVAQTALGDCYHTLIVLDKEVNNRSAVKQYYAQGIAYYRLAAAQGLAEAQLRLGSCYDSGIGVDQNNQKALEFYQQAANQDLPEALGALSWIYLFGRLGVQKDEKKSQQLWEKRGLIRQQEDNEKLSTEAASSSTSVSSDTKLSTVPTRILSASIATVLSSSSSSDTSTNSPSTNAQNTNETSMTASSTTTSSIDNVDENLTRPGLPSLSST